MSFPRTLEASTRVESVDAYRGFVMVALAIEGYIPAVANRFPSNSLWRELARQFDHVPWAGAVFWDLIQPSFMFIVGVSMAFSYYSRMGRGSSWKELALHALRRSAIFILLGFLIVSDNKEHTNYNFFDVISQIGLAYPFVFLLIGKKPRIQLSAAIFVLLAYWLAFYLYPVSAARVDIGTIGLTSDSGRFSGLFAHWNKYANFGAVFDSWFLNLFPRSEIFTYYPAGLTTLNFVPSIVTLLAGVMAGELLRGTTAGRDKVRKLCGAGLASFLLGEVLGYTVCPIVKSIWTPSWVAVSSGFTLWLLAGFYWLVDCLGWRRMFLPFIVVGMNSLAMYLMLRLFKPWVWQTVEIHGGLLAWSCQFAIVVLILWSICYWMYRRKLFIRL